MKFFVFKDVDAMDVSDSGSDSDNDMEEISTSAEVSSGKRRSLKNRLNLKNIMYICLCLITIIFF